MILVVAFFGIGGYFIATQHPLSSNSSSSSTSSSNQVYFSSGKKGSTSTNNIPDMTSAFPIVIGMIVLALGLSIILICLMARFPKCLVYTMLVSVFIVLIALGIILLSQGQMAGALLLVMVVGLAVWLYCLRGQIDLGIALLRISG